MSREDTFSRSPVDYSEINVVFVCAYGAAFSSVCDTARQGMTLKFIMLYNVNNAMS